MVEEEKKTELVATTFEGENLLLVWSDEEREARQQELLDKAAAYSPFTDMTGDFRIDTAAYHGGFELRDADQTSLLRSAIGEIISVSEVPHGVVNLQFFCSLGRRSQNLKWRLQFDPDQLPDQVHGAPVNADD